MEERGLLMYHLNLEIRDRLDDITSPSNWLMSDALKVTFDCTAFPSSANIYYCPPCS